MAGRKKTNSVRVEISKTPTGYNFRLCTTVNGKRHRKGLGTVKGGKRSKEFLEMKRTAEKIAVLEQKKLTERAYGIQLERTEEISLHSFLLNYSQNYTKKDNRKVKAVVNRAIGFFDNSVHLHTLAEDDVEEFVDSIKEETKSETARGYVQAFKKALESGVKKGLIYQNPARNIVVKTEHDRLLKDVLTQKELRLLEATPCGNEHVRNAFLFSCLTGLGMAECRKLRWEDIKKEDDTHYLHFARGKTKRVGKVKLSKAMKFIGNGNSKSGFVFPKLPTTNGANKILKNWIKRAQIDKKITFYCGRHTFGTLQALAGADLLTIAKNMAHADTKHTVKYLNYVQTNQDKAIDAIGF